MKEENSRESVASLEKWQSAFPDKFRFAGYRGDRCSHVWSLAAHKSDLYLAQDKTGKSLKISLHESGHFRVAFQERLHTNLIEKGFFAPGSDRAIAKWRRPDADLSSINLVLAVLLPEKFFGGTIAEIESKTPKVLVEIAEGAMLEVSLFHADQSAQDMAGRLGAVGTPLWKVNLGGAGQFSVVARQLPFNIASAFPNGQLPLPAQTMLPGADLNFTPRSIGSLLFTDPVAKGYMEILELGQGTITRSNEAD